jgi:hypothetical protein
MNGFDRRKMKRAVFSERVIQLRRSQNELLGFRVADMGNRQSSISVIGFLAEKSAQPKIVIEWIFDIKWLQPLLIETDKLRGN